MNKKFFTELARRLRADGIATAPPQDRGLSVLLHDEPVLLVAPGSDLFHLPAGSNNPDVNELYHRVDQIAGEVYAYVESVQTASLLRASGLNEKFYLLADFGGAVLAGRELENGLGYQFVTWIWDHNRMGVSHGHYYQGDYQGAKEDFAVRSGLISNAQLFTPEQLTELYRASEYLLDEGPGLDDQQLKALQESRTKIEYTVPDLIERLEQKQEQEPQLNM